MKRPYTPTSKPATSEGTVLVTFENGVTAILPATTECWGVFEPAPIRALFNLPPLDDDDPVPQMTLADVQQERDTPSVCIRVQPGVRGTGYESVKVESKDERIARLEASLAQQKARANAALGAVQAARKTVNDMVPLRKPAPMIYDGQNAKALDPVQPYQPRGTDR